MVNRSLRNIAFDIVERWDHPPIEARPYILAMTELDGIDETYGPAREPARDIVQYFLTNAEHWRGPHAQRIKAELREMVGEK